MFWGDRFKGLIVNDVITIIYDFYVKRRCKMREFLRIILILNVIVLDYIEKGAHAMARWLKQKTPHWILIIAIIFLYIALIMQKMIGYLLKKIDALDEG